jgi:hypothetical protein
MDWAGIRRPCNGAIMNKPLAASVLTAALVGMPLTQALAQTCSKQSPPHTVALLELYTSEGCSSCPPADKFVSNLRAGGLPAEQVVPLSLHVDYWDYIGWKDLFARRDYTDRQRWLSELADTRTIYTPEIFVAGREVRDWNGSVRGGVAEVVKQINTKPAQADIGITLGKPSGGTLPVEIHARAAQGGKLYVALYENGLKSEVRAGENEGETLKHDFVVRDWIGPIVLDGKGGKVALPRALKMPAGAVAKNLGVAAFVQTDKGEVLQALSLPVCAG